MRKNSGNIFIELLQTVVLALAIFMIAYLFLFQPHQVDGESMNPNFDNHEYLLTEKVSYRFNSPKRGDVIVFIAPVNRREDYIKRIIGLPGEKINILNGKVYINSKELPEPYLPQGTFTDTGAFLTGSEYQIKDNEYIVLGDNRAESSDSRSWGVITKHDFVGRAWVVYWPIPSVEVVSRVNYSNF